MTTVLTVLLCLFGVLLFIEFGALVEMFHQLKQVRIYLDMVDRPTPLDLGKASGLAATAVGLPAALDDTKAALVLFLSNRCETCHTIAAAIDGGALPQNLWLVVVPVFEDAEEFVEKFHLRGKRSLIDDGRTITGRLGLDITPAAVVVEYGRVARAQTVPTVRQMYAAIPSVHKPTPQPAASGPSTGRPALAPLTIDKMGR